MKKSTIWALAAIMVCFAPAGLVPRTAFASDHADPMSLRDPESDITGLFFFPKDDQMILILNIRRALTAPGPYDLEPFEYAVHMDLRSRVTYDNASEYARYGGTIVSPEGLADSATITFHLNDDTTVRDVSYAGLENQGEIRVFSGVRDDPFIFPRFFQRNVISMAMSIPMTAFPAGQQDWILWGTTSRDGEQIDHVGRSNRTQLARFGFLNTLPPSEHVATIMEMMASQQRRYNFVNKYQQTQPIAMLLQYLIDIRPYDLVPDVMIYTTRFPEGFPNGRRLEDDVAGLTCHVGDCALQETAFIEGGWPRRTVNDKPFLDDFPYLAEPWPDSPQAPPPASIWPSVIGLLVVLLASVTGLWYLKRWYRGRLAE